MTPRRDDRIRKLIAVIEQAQDLARAAGQDDVEALLEASIEAILLGPAAMLSADLLQASRHKGL